MHRLESLLYFASNTIVILAGLILILTVSEAIGGSLAAAGIVGMVMYWAIYIQRKKTSEEERLLQQIRRFGIVDLLARRLTKQEADELFGNRARKSMDVLGFSLVSFYGDVKDSHLVKVAQKAKIRLLTVHPESPYCAQRDYEESLLPGTTKNEVLKLTRYVKELNNTNIEIRWYKSIPSTSIEIVDDEEMAVGPYLVGWEHRNTYSLRIKQGVLFDYYRTHFHKIWTDPNLSCVPDFSIIS